MTRSLKLVGGAVALLVVMIGALYAYRSLMLWDGRTPEGYQMLTAVPDASGFEPGRLPAGPVLENQSTNDLTVNFGYKVANIPYSYSLALSFPPKALGGRATVTVRHATRSASTDAAVRRQWDEPRKAYAVAVQNRFEAEPNAPSLCIKAVIGPSDTSYDLKDGSICIAQRDTAGNCHPETLACGLIRQ